jgi:hypothetical protein
MTGKRMANTEPDAQLEALVPRTRAVTENWAKLYDFWHDSGYKHPLKHCDSEPDQGIPAELGHIAG